MTKTKKESVGFKTISFESEEEWLQAREGKIMGTKLGGLITLRGDGKKKGFWELIAERVAIKEDNNENPMERGKRLECEAIAMLEKELGKKFDTSLVMWVLEQDENIAISPDGFLGVELAVEAKCLNSASHIEALITQQIPKDYYFQKLQYFIVNPKLLKLYFAFFDPRIAAKPFFYIMVTREEVQEDVKKYLEEEIKIIKEVEDITNRLTF